MIELFQDGITISADLDSLGEGVAFGVPATQGPVEAAVVALLQDAGSRRRARRVQDWHRRRTGRTVSRL